ncbi:MAG: baseplate hub protein, partial [Stellaceae bacterium]
MKPASTALKSLLATRQFYAADLYTFALVGGGTLRYCGGDRDITANGNLYPAGGATGPYFDRKDNKAKCHWKVGVEVDQLVFDVLPG